MGELVSGREAWSACEVEFIEGEVDDRCVKVCRFGPLLMCCLDRQ